MTKTELSLLCEAARHPRGVVATISGYVSGRKKSAYGHRASNAACKLRDKGLFEHVKGSSHVYHLCHGYGADHSFESVWRITDAGRTALGKALG